MIEYKGYKVLPDDDKDSLYNHPAVLECAVIGIPDQEIGETIKAFVVVGEEHSESRRRGRHNGEKGGLI